MQKRTFLKSVAALLAGSTTLVTNSTQAAETLPANTKRMAFIYFSKTGHTESVARATRAMTGCDIFAVKTVAPYPEAYRPTTEIVKKEIEEGIIRELQPLDVDLSKYDVIAFGTPTWWHHVAVPLQTWIKKQDLKGKFIVTCNTHGGGGLMHTREDFEALLKDSGAKLGTHLTVFGSVSESDGDVRLWLKENSLL